MGGPVDPRELANVVCYWLEAACNYGSVVLATYKKLPGHACTCNNCPSIALPSTKSVCLCLALRCVYRLQEKHNREKLRDHLKSMVDTQEELKEVQAKVKLMQAKIKDAHLRQERLLGSSNR